MNLESEIYRLSLELSENLDENDINKLLGILANDGVYAMWVYAMDKFKKGNGKLGKVQNLIKELDKFVKVEINGDINDTYFQNLAQDLNKLLYMKELLEKVLIYARYHARARGE